MPFIANPAAPTDEGSIENFSDFWPDIDAAAARSVMRLESDITTTRLTALLQNAMIDVNQELATYTAQKQLDGITFEALSSTEKHQYQRAVFATAQAQLLEDMHDYDSTATGQDKADESRASIDVQRRVATLAIRSILGKSYSHIELI